MGSNEKSTKYIIDTKSKLLEYYMGGIQGILWMVDEDIINGDRVIELLKSLKEEIDSMYDKIINND